MQAPAIYSSLEERNPVILMLEPDRDSNDRIVPAQIPALFFSQLETMDKARPMIAASLPHGENREGGTR
jgi:hypothetical protein